MKLVLVIVNSEDTGRLVDKLAKNKIRVTKLASTGGFLRAGNSTLLIGTEDEKVEDVITIIKETCSSRVQTITAPSFGVSSGVNIPMDVVVGGATIFVIDVDRYEKI